MNNSDLATLKAGDFTVLERHGMLATIEGRDGSVITCQVAALPLDPDSSPVTHRCELARERVASIVAQTALASIGALLGLSAVDAMSFIQQTFLNLS